MSTLRLRRDEGTHAAPIEVPAAPVEGQEQATETADSRGAAVVALALHRFAASQARELERQLEGPARRLAARAIKEVERSEGRPFTPIQRQALELAATFEMGTIAQAGHAALAARGDALLAIAKGEG